MDRAGTADEELERLILALAEGRDACSAGTACARVAGELLARCAAALDEDIEILLLHGTRLVRARGRQVHLARRVPAARRRRRGSPERGRSVPPP